MEAIRVSQLNAYVDAMLKKDPLLRNLRVEGELSGFKRHSSGHLYFSLKDAQALIRGVMFRQDAQQTLDFSPEDGMQVIVTGHVALYTRDGQYQLYAQSMQQQGAGALYARFIRLKETLEAQGYFDVERKKPIPFLPACVGIITAQTGAALQDMLQIIGRRFAPMPIQVCPVRVQGDGAARDIAAAIQYMNAQKKASVLLVGRGGGSLEDLWAFNEKVVADAIFQSEIPIISAVGHETDFTISDFVADLRAPTPSAAAELCVPEYDALLQQVDLLVARLPRALHRGIQERRSRLEILLQARGFASVGHSLAAKRHILEDSLYRMHTCMAMQLQAQRSLLNVRQASLEALSLQKMLARGFAHVSDKQGNTLSAANLLHANMAVTLRMHDGLAHATIETVEMDEVHTNAKQNEL